MIDDTTITMRIEENKPNGIKIVEIGHSTEQAIVIPRNLLNNAKHCKYISYPGIYFLIENAVTYKKPLVYIGQSRNCLKRINDHDREKDFWDYAILIISKIDTFTPTNIEYLEHISIEEANKANRYKLVNKNIPKTFSISKAEKNNIIHNFKNIKILLSVLGFNIFDYIKNENYNTYYCNNKNARGQFTTDGFVVYQGSIANELSEKCGNHIKRIREELLENKIVKKENNKYKFIDDYLFQRPSIASSQILGYNSNGWKDWKNENNKTLDEIERQ